MRIAEIIPLVPQTALLLDLMPTSRCAGSLWHVLATQEIQFCFHCRQGLNLVLALLMHGTCNLPFSVLRNEEWRPVLSSGGFVEVIYTKRCLRLVMGCYINTDTTFIYTVQPVERYNFSEWPALPDLCSVELQGELGRICLMCWIAKVRFFVCACGKIESAFIDFGCHCNMVLHVRSSERVSSSHSCSQYHCNVPIFLISAICQFLGHYKTCRT